MDRKTKMELLPGLDYILERKYPITPAELKIVRLLMKEGAMTAKDIRRKLRKNRSTIDNRINKLKMKGLVHMVDKKDAYTHILDVI
jgi:predicted transcriptional regulator